MKNKVPKLRFKEFSDEWEEKKLGEVLFERKIKQKISEIAPLLAFAAGQGVIDRSERKTNNRDFLTKDSTQKKYLFTKYNDIVYNPSNLKYGAIDRNKYGQGVISPIYVTFETSEVSSFIELIVKSENFKQRALKYEEGTVTKRQSVKPENLLSLNIIKPDLKEQEKIANFLSSVDTKIEMLEKKKELLSDYKKGMMQKLFSQKLRFKDETGNNYPEWEEKKLNELCLINPKSIILPDEFIYIDLESVNSGVLTKLNKITKNDAPSRAQRILEKKDILYQTVRPYQKNNLYFNLDSNIENYVASTGYAQIRSKESSEYIYQYLHTEKFVNIVLENCTGTSYPAINSTDLGNLYVRYPSLPEQEKIANFLFSIDKKIEIVERELEKNKEFKKGLLQQMFVNNFI